MTDQHRSSNYQWGERAIALPPGEWVLQGLVWVFNEAPIETRIIHGTDRGYHQHRNYSIPQCDDCREAHRLEWHTAKQKVAA